MTSSKSAGPTPFFSVILNIYNGEKFLREAIDSIIAQTFQDWELILWDDQSTDESATICREYDDPRFRYYFSSDHSTLGSARDRALDQAQGTWCAFIDQDDIWAPTKLAGQGRLIDEDETDRLGLVYGRAIRFGARGTLGDFSRWHEGKELPQGRVFSELIAMPSFMAMSSSVLKREAVASIGGVPPHIVYCPDYYLQLMIAKDYLTAGLQEPCCWYRIHETNMSHSIRRQVHTEILEIFEGFKEDIDPSLYNGYRKRHLTLIGLEELTSLSTLTQGLMRLFREGSLSYLISRPWVRLARITHKLLRVR